MSSTQPISVVIPLYFCSPTLYAPIQKCLQALERCGITPTVLDDCSPLEIPAHWPVEGRNYQNLGFTKTVNKLLESANGKVIVVMNDDIIMTEECLERFKLLSGAVIASPLDTASSQNDKFGACWGITQEAYKILGPMNEKYKNFFSDTEYYERAKERGITIIKWTDITLEHPESSTYKQLDKEALLKEDALIYDMNR